MLTEEDQRAILLQLGAYRPIKVTGTKTFYATLYEGKGRGGNRKWSVRVEYVVSEGIVAHPLDADGDPYRPYEDLPKGGVASIFPVARLPIVGTVDSGIAFPEARRDRATRTQREENLVSDDATSDSNDTSSESDETSSQSDDTDSECSAHIASQRRRLQRAALPEPQRVVVRERDAEQHRQARAALHVPNLASVLWTPEFNLQRARLTFYFRWIRCDQCHALILENTETSERMRVDGLTGDHGRLSSNSKSLLRRGLSFRPNTGP